MLNYEINENGVMTIYINNVSLCEISDCERLTNEEINNLIFEILNESDIELLLEEV